MTGWWERGPLPAVLDVRADDRSPSGGASLVSIRYRSRLARLGAVACWSLLAGWVLLVTVVVENAGLRAEYEATIGSVGQPLVAALVVTLILLRSRTRRLFLTDPILGVAASGAAAALGRGKGRGRWRIQGVVAARIGADLVRLHRLWTADSHGPGRQRALLEQACPELRAFMGPAQHPPRVERFREPDDLEPARYEVGDAWPSLDQRAQNDTDGPIPAAD